MNHTQRAIELAIEGGYMPWQYLKASKAMQDYWKDKGLVIWEQAVLEVLFWQCLGKSLGWGDEKNCPVCWQKMVITGTGWMCHWHRFIDTLASGKTAEDFFGELLANK